MNFESNSAILDRRSFLRTASTLGAAALTSGPPANFVPIRHFGELRLKVALNAYSFSKPLNDHNKQSIVGMSLLELIDFCDVVQVRFDSHVVSYHQIAQPIVDAVFAGKRLKQRVHIEVIDKAKGEFMIRFLPLMIDPADPHPQGFDGGHLHHPIHDEPPRGRGFECDYEAPK